MKTKNILPWAILALCITSCHQQSNDYDAMGVFETVDVVVSAKGTGELKQFDLYEGQLVDSGCPLGYIDTIQLSLQKIQLLSNQSATSSRKLNESQQVASIQQQIQNLQKEKNRFEELLNKKAATQKQVDDINYQLNVLEKQLSATIEKINSSNHSLSQQTSGISAQIAMVDELIHNNYIYSPIKGTILTKYMEKGEFAIPGKSLFKVADLENIKLRAYVYGKQLTQIKLGQKVSVYSDWGDNSHKEYDGEIVWISDVAEFTPKTIQTRDERSNLVYAIKIAVKNDGYIKRGMYGEVKFSK